MYGSANFFKNFRVCLLFFSIQIQSQLYNDQQNSEIDQSNNISMKNDIASDLDDEIPF